MTKLRIIKNTTNIEPLAKYRYLLYIDTGLIKMYEGVTVKSLCKYIKYKLTRKGL